MEDGPAEIIWQGNEIIVKKPRKKVRKGTHSGALAIEVTIVVFFWFCFLFSSYRALCRILFIQHTFSTERFLVLRLHIEQEVISHRLHMRAILHSR